MGVVFRATDLDLLRPVAVKILAERLDGGARAAVGTGEEGTDGDKPEGVGNSEARRNPDDIVSPEEYEALVNDCQAPCRERDVVRLKKLMDGG